MTAQTKNTVLRWIVAAVLAIAGVWTAQQGFQWATSSNGLIVTTTQATDTP